MSEKTGVLQIMTKPPEVSSHDTAPDTASADVRMRGQHENQLILDILSEVESREVAQAILDGMKLISDGLNMVAQNYYHGDAKKLGKHRALITRILRRELETFLSTMHVEKNKRGAILNLYAPRVNDKVRERDDVKQEQPGMKTEMAVECENTSHGQDAYFMLPQGNAFGVFDGVSAATNGADAARIAATRAEEMFMALGDGEQKTTEEIKRAISDMLKQVSAELYSLGTKRIEAYQTTASIACIHQEKDGSKRIIVGNVGDSRVYIFRQGALQQVTLDDGSIRSLVGESGDETQAREVQSVLNNADSMDGLTEEQGKLFEKRNMLQQALGYGFGEKVDPRMYVADVDSSDIILVSSDGIHDPLTDNEIAEILRKHQGMDSRGLARTIIESVHKRNSDKNHRRGKPDDMTILVVQVQ